MAIYKKREQINAHKWTEYCTIYDINIHYYSIASYGEGYNSPWTININGNFYTIYNSDYIVAENEHNIKIIPKDIFELVYEPNEFI